MCATTTVRHESEIKDTKMTPGELRRLKKEGKLSKPEHEAKVANALIEAFVRKNNLVALKIIFYLSKSNPQVLNQKLITMTIDANNLCEYCNIIPKTLRRNIQKMQETVIEFIDENNDIEDIVVIPRAKYITGKSKLEIDMYAKMLKLISHVKNRYTVIDTKNLMKLESKHSVRMIALLEHINTFSKDVAKRKTYTLEDLNRMFGTNYSRMAEFERRILKPVKEELDSISKLSFQYEINYELQSKGRPKAVSATIDLIHNTPQGKLF